MTRIFTTLSLFTIAMLATNVFLGLRIGGSRESFHDVRQQVVAIHQEIASLRERRPLDEARIDGLEEEIRRQMDQFGAIKPRATLHLGFGVVTALVTMLVNCIAVTYFVGTSRWCKEVVDTYGLDKTLSTRSTLLKRRNFPWALGAMLVILAVAAMGQAANPGTGRGGTAPWVTPHFVAALAGTALIGWSFLVQVGNIGANHQVIEDVLAQVRRIRTERGLEVE